MPFIASNDLTEADTSKTIQAGGITVHYHDIGSGEPVLFLHYGPGTTAWITFHKTVGALSQHECRLAEAFLELHHVAGHHIPPPEEVSVRGMSQTPDG
jgi:hypothetical protein